MSSSNPAHMPVRCKPWQALLAIVLGLVASTHSWHRDELAHDLLTGGQSLDGVVSAIRHMSASRMCSFSYQFTSPDGAWRSGHASLGSPHCAKLKAEVRKKGQVLVDVLWQAPGRFMLRLDAQDRIRISGGWPTYVLRFALIATGAFILAIAIGSILSVPSKGAEP